MLLGVEQPEPDNNLPSIESYSRADLEEDDPVFVAWDENEGKAYSSCGVPVPPPAPAPLASPVEFELAPVSIADNFNPDVDMDMDDFFPALPPVPLYDPALPSDLNLGLPVPSSRSVPRPPPPIPE
jgi:hypothetical protein